MKKISLLALIFFSSFVSAQDIVSNEKQPKPFKNFLELELGGHGGLYSFNYERILIYSPRFQTLASIGIAYYPPILPFTVTLVPINVSQLIPCNTDHLELGFGCTLYQIHGLRYKDIPENYENGALGTLTIGYRYQAPSKHFVFRYALTPFVYRLDFARNKNVGSSFFIPSLGCLLGYSF